MRRGASGDVIGGKYRLLSELGQGGTGTVWRALHLTLECPIAIKLIDPIVALGPEARRRFLHEARAAAAIRSPHVVQVLDYGVDADMPYIAMELLEGESLAASLQRRGRLSVTEAARVIRQVARALGRAHDANIVHRDLKPENIFSVRNDDDTIIKVLDFGVAKVQLVTFGASTASLATRSGTLMGTPYFMSPEQAHGARSVDFRTDLWALGVTAFECLLGELPFKGDSVGRVVLAVCSDPLPVPSERGDVPQGFDAWFARACARDPAARFASAKQAADAFDLLAAQSRAEHALRVRQTPSSVSARGMGASRRLRTIASLLVIGALLVGAGVVGVWWNGLRARAIPEEVASQATAPTPPARPEQASAQPMPPQPTQPAHAGERVPELPPRAGSDRAGLAPPGIELGSAQTPDRPTEGVTPPASDGGPSAPRSSIEARRSRPAQKGSPGSRAAPPKTKGRLIDLGF